MIEIRKMPDGNPMIISSVSDFCSSMGYCELRIKHFLKGIKPPDTKITIEGTESHEKEVEFEKEHFEFVPISQEELEDIKNDVEFARESIFTRYPTVAEFGNEKVPILILGQADKIVRSKGTLIVEDSKYPNDREKYLERIEPYEDQIMQALLYLNSLFTENESAGYKEWFAIPHEKKAWIINIKDKQTGESIKIFEGIQTKGAEEFLRDRISKFALIVLGKIEPEHHNNVGKCRSCRFLDICEYKIA